MSLLERIRADQASLRKRRDLLGASALGVVITGANHRARMISPQRALTDTEVAGVVRAVIRQIDRMLAKIAGDPNRQARAECLLIERNLLLKYVEQPLTDDEVANIAMRQHSIMGYNQIITYLRQHYSGRFDLARAT